MELYPLRVRRLRYQILCLLFLLTFLAGVVYFKYVEQFNISTLSTRTTSVPSSFVDEYINGKYVSGIIVEAEQRELENRSRPTTYQEQRELENRSRLTAYRNVCAVRKREIKSNDGVLYHKNPGTNRSLSYCPIPKVGTVYWRRMFQFLKRTNDTRHVASPFDITRQEVYRHPLVKLHTVRYNDDVMADALRFFFVRDPYSRLVSLYIDKFLLLAFMRFDIYCKTLAAYRGYRKSTINNHTCLKNVSFADVIEKIILAGVENEHWKHQHILCDPCKLYPHFIGKQETFSADAKYILGKAGLQHLLQEYTHQTYVKDEIEETVKERYNDRYLHQPLRQCFDVVEVASRLWRAFQMNGYLPSSVKFPLREIETLLSGANRTGVIDVVTRFIVKENARAHMSRDQHSKQKRNMLIQEFRTLSRDTMEKLANMYDADFRMFGYEKYPKELFPWRY